MDYQVNLSLPEIEFLENHLIALMKDNLNAQYFIMAEAQTIMITPGLENGTEIANLLMEHATSRIEGNTQLYNSILEHIRAARLRAKQCRAEL